ncbi:dihydrofolate reductase family protein [Jiangella mangrovi]|uniref:Dihydrofolate reductase n=1 Tax=Jiangella mangrovi TaxID=1524084 RepID=A0A7W9GT47_9ACTN|nr:dihydrofolate reductase family protein [Jiangella mangrovi]MBB5789575.1 dihydrofolate reductase [Jiangella mangrovi]
MRTLIVTNIVSADGYYNGPGQDVMVMPFDSTFDDYNAARLRAASTLLLGRTSYEGFRSYWPPVASQPEVPEVEREISRLTTAIDKVVVSDRPAPDPSSPWGEALFVPRAKAASVVADLKASGADGDIIVFGSRTLWTSLLRAGLLDEVHLLVGSAFLGGGTPVWDGGPRTPLRLLDAHRLGDSQLALLRYDARPTA